MKLETAKRWLILFYEKIQENVAVLAELDSTMGWAEMETMVKTCYVV